MKTLLLLFLFWFCSAPLFAQVTSRDSVSNGSTSIREKLVALAMQNPDLEVADHLINVAKYNLKAARGWWAENISLSFNANEYSLKRLDQQSTPAPGQYYPYYPLYNVGVNIPIGGVFTKPPVAKAAQEQVAIAQEQRASKAREIRAAVLTAYENYLSNKELYTVESQIAESAYNDYLQAKDKFRNGQISVTDYNSSTNQYQSALKSRITSENSFNLTKIQLEALIGVPIDQVLANMSTNTAPR